MDAQLPPRGVDAQVPLRVEPDDRSHLLPANENGAEVIRAVHTTRAKKGQFQ